MSRHNQNSQNYNKEHLLKNYQSEITDNINRKFNDKLQNLQQERIEMQKLQSELDSEKMRKMQSRNDIINSQREEYKNYLDTKRVKKNNEELQGTYKIGGENREIRRKNYNDISDKMNLNITRKENYQKHAIDYTQMPNQQVAVNRARSQGYNIINHDVFAKNNNPSSLNLIQNQNQNKASNNYNTEVGRYIPQNTYENTYENNNNNNYDEYELNKYGYGNNYENKNEVLGNVSKPSENQNYDINNNYAPVNDYAKMYEEYMKNQNQQNQNSSNDPYSDYLQGGQMQPQRNGYLDVNKNLYIKLYLYLYYFRIPKTNLKEIIYSINNKMTLLQLWIIIIAIAIILIAFRLVFTKSQLTTMRLPKKIISQESKNLISKKLIEKCFPNKYIKLNKIKN